MKNWLQKIANCLCLAASLATGSAFAQTKLTLVEVLTSPERTKILSSLVEEFEVQNPDIDVEIITLNWSFAFNQLASMVLRGEVPDVVEMPDSWLALYAGNNMLVNLDETLANWEHGESLSQKARDMGSLAGGKMHTIPSGFYLRAMFYNKSLLAAANIDHPPHTMAEFMEAAEKISKIPGKSGYCLRGGSGSLGSWIMFAATMNGTNELFTEDGKSRLNEPGAIPGFQFLIDMYQKGFAPKQSINWGFSETVREFYTGKCAFLDQDSDALPLILEHMSAEEFSVAPMPLGASGKAYPTMGFAGWSAFTFTENRDEAIELVKHLSTPRSNLIWTTNNGALPIHKGAEKQPHFATEQYKGWFKTLNDEKYIPTIMPVYLNNFGIFREIAASSSQEALLGERSAKDLANAWARFLTNEYASWKSTR